MGDVPAGSPSSATVDGGSTETRSDASRGRRARSSWMRAVTAARSGASGRRGEVGGVRVHRVGELAQPLLAAGDVEQSLWCRGTGLRGLERGERGTEITRAVQRRTPLEVGTGLLHVAGRGGEQQASHHHRQHLGWRR